MFLPFTHFSCFNEVYRTPSIMFSRSCECGIQYITMMLTVYQYNCYISMMLTVAFHKQQLLNWVNSLLFLVCWEFRSWIDVKLCHSPPASNKITIYDFTHLFINRINNRFTFESTFKNLHFLESTWPWFIITFICFQGSIYWYSIEDFSAFAYVFSVTQSCLFSVTQSCLTLWPMDCGLPRSSIRANFLCPAKILEWVAISFSRACSQARDWTHVFCVSCVGSWILYHWANR